MILKRKKERGEEKKKESLFKKSHLIVTYKHHEIKSQSLIHIINFLLETSCDFECIAITPPPFQTIAKMKFEVENGICGRFNQPNWGLCSA